MYGRCVGSQVTYTNILKLSSCGRLFTYISKRDVNMHVELLKETDKNRTLMQHSHAYTFFFNYGK